MFERHQVNVDLLKTRLDELLASCTRLEVAAEKTGSRGHAISSEIDRLSNQVEKFELTTRPSRFPISELGINPYELGALRFPDSKNLFEKARKGDRPSTAVLITKLKACVDLWNRRVVEVMELERSEAAKSSTNLEDTPIPGSSLRPSSSPTRASVIASAPVVLLLGAGASAPLGLPTMSQFWDRIAAVASREVWDARDALNGILDVFQTDEGDGHPDLEELLALLERYKTYSDIIFDDPYFGFPSKLTINAFGPYFHQKYRSELDRSFDRVVWLSKGISRLTETMPKLIHSLYWPRLTSPQSAARVVALFSPLVHLLLRDLSLPFVPIFSTNYDPLVEKYCEVTNSNLEYGFERQGARLRWNNSRFGLFQPDGGKSNVVLFKLHGSLAWRREGDDIYDYGLSLNSGPGESALIYPTATKEYPYEEPFKTGYRYLGDCLSRAKVAIAIGYTFRDRGIHYVIKEAEQLNPELRFFLVCGPSFGFEAITSSYPPRRYKVLPCRFEPGDNPEYLQLLRGYLQGIVAPPNDSHQ